MSDGSLRPSMKLLFVILAHDRPAEVAELARTLVAAGSDARALIHFDARAEARAFDGLAAAVADEPRIGLVARRVACRWGGFGLVEAPLNALAQAEAEGQSPDYAILLSGACLPCRPVASLERFLRRERRARVHRVRGRELDHRRLALGALALLALVRPQDPAPARVALGAASRRRSGCGGASRPGSSRASARSGGR